MLKLSGHLHKPRFAIKELVEDPALGVWDAECDAFGIRVAENELPLMAQAWWENRAEPWNTLIVDDGGLLLIGENLTDSRKPALKGRFYPSITCGAGCIEPERVASIVLEFCALDKACRPAVTAEWTRYARFAVQDLDRSHVTITHTML